MASKGSPALPVPLVAAAALVLAGGTAGYFYYEKARNRAPDVPVLTQEAAGYLSNLKLSDVEMKAAESYLKQSVTTIAGKIANDGPRGIRLVEILCVFRDPYGQIVLRERVAIVGRKTGPAGPGQARAFTLTFDNIPSGWNQALPDLVISQIQFTE